MCESESIYLIKVHSFSDEPIKDSRNESTRPNIVSECSASDIAIYVRGPPVKSLSWCDPSTAAKVSIIPEFSIFYVHLRTL